MSPLGCRPLQITGLHDNESVPDDAYFTYVLGHELGHNFGISQEYNMISGDIMDHNAGNQLFIAHPVYVDMYTSWAECYWICN